MAHVVALVGDVFVDRNDPERVFDGCRPFVEDATFWLANLESPLTNAGDDLRSHRSWWHGGFKTDPATAPVLSSFTAVSIANNHLLDFGVPGYLDTIELLDDVGVGYAGGGRDLAAARRPFVTQKDGLSVALLAYTCVYQPGWGATDSTPGMAVLEVHTAYEPTNRVLEQPGMAPIVRTFMDPAAVRSVQEDVAGARSQADVVVVSVHWGVSKGGEGIVEYQRELGRACVDAGAHVVFGHHPHVLQPLEIYDGGWIFYSLGNFVFDMAEGWFDARSLLVRCYVRDGRVAEVGLVPLTVDESYRPVPCTGGTAEEIVESVLTSSDRASLSPRSSSASEWVLTTDSR
jgi:hypothetical protein